MKPINVGLLGLGTVGGGTLTVLRRNEAEITRRAGRAIRVKVAVVRNLQKAQAQYAGGDITISTDPMAVVDNPTSISWWKRWAALISPNLWC